MTGWSNITSRAYLLAAANIDTDQIIPASFLTTTTRSGLGRYAFAQWRFDADGNERVECPLNDSNLTGASIIVGGANFGCGSSREHAAWALQDFGIRVVISSQIADIFKSNAIKNGIAPVEISESEHACLVESLRRDPGLEIAVSLTEQTVRWHDHVVHFTLEAFGCRCLMEGLDPLGWLLRMDSHIAAYEEKSACMP